MKIFTVLFATLSILLVSCATMQTDVQKGIVIENEQVKLVIGSDGMAQSLVYKPTGEECLMQGQDIAVFSVTQERPYNNEVKLAHPNKRTTYQADTVSWDGDKLVVGFETIPYEAVISVKAESDYIMFSLEGFNVEEGDYRVRITPPPVSEMCFLKLPVRNKIHFGEWLNVSWDDNIAVNILGTDQYAKIDAEKRKDYRIMSASADAGVKLRGVGAALIVSDTKELLDKIAVVEEDFNLPKGSKSRRDDRLKLSYYWTANINPSNLDQHLKYAKMGGFRLMTIYYPAFIKSNGYRYLGNYDWRKRRISEWQGGSCQYA